MLKGITREITLSIQARNGMSPPSSVWTAVIGFAAFVAFVFLCVAGYAWLSLRFDAVIAGLIMAGIFAVVAAVRGAHRGAHPSARQGTRDPGARRQSALAVMAARSENSRRRRRGRPHHRLAADRAGRRVGFVVAQWMREVRGPAAAARAHRTNKQRNKSRSAETRPLPAPTLRARNLAVLVHLPHQIVDRSKCLLVADARR